jgi:hypothetical protein
MARMIIDETTNIIETSYDLISKEKCLVTLGSGCVWSRLLDNGKPIGLVFSGPAEFVVDAIAETDRGAVGESISGSFKGIQVYFGPTEIDDISRVANDIDFQQTGYKNSHEFLEAAWSKLDDLGATKDERRGTLDEEGVIIGTDQEDEKIVLVAKDPEIVLVRGKSVFVVKEDRLVSVEKSGVTVTESSGKTITIGKNGIGGIDIPGIKGLGQSISNIVGISMMGLKGLKGLKSLKKLRSSDIEGLDWEDEG